MPTKINRKKKKKESIRKRKIKEDGEQKKRYPINFCTKVSNT